MERKEHKMTLKNSIAPYQHCRYEAIGEWNYGKWMLKCDNEHGAVEDLFDQEIFVSYSLWNMYEHALLVYIFMTYFKLLSGSMSDFISQRACLWQASPILQNNIKNLLSFLIDSAY